MAELATGDYQVVRRGLGRVLRQLRADCPPVETARLLLSYDGPGQPLVGLRYDGGRAVYVDEVSRRVIGAAFGAEGLDGRDCRPLATLPAGGPVSGWVERESYY